MGRPKLNRDGNAELERAEEQFDNFDKQVQSMTLDHMNEAPKLEQEPQTKLAQADLQKSKEVYLKPQRSIGSREKFNENFRDDYNFAKEYVNFISENKEIIGESIEMWTKPFPGVPAEFWIIPVNKSVWAPRYVAEQIKRKNYHRLTMDNRATHSDGTGQYFGNIVVDNTVQRLDAYPVSSKKSLFMGANF